jgi:hypothetical protein
LPLEDFHRRIEMAVAADSNDAASARRVQ